VQYLREGQEYFQPAKVVLLSSYTYENVRLLLLSKSKAYPTDSSTITARWQKLYRPLGESRGHGALPLRPEIWYGANAQGVVVHDWADDSFDHAGLGFIGGASLTVNHEVHPIASQPSRLRQGAQWGAKWKAFLHENAGRWVGAYAQCNSLPYENTWLDLDPT